MEVGAVKQAFNNEVILLKKNLNQAKIQVIHKLTRKAKTFAEKKCPDKLKEKLKRKAESAVNEVLLIKKIKTKDVAKFALIHKGELNSYLNRPKVDEDKVCARLLLHKPLQEKYKFLRNRFGGIPIADLFMSRAERRKLKKEARENKKNKKKQLKEDETVTKHELSDFSEGDDGSSDEMDLSGNDNDINAEDNEIVNSSSTDNEESDDGSEHRTSNNEYESSDDKNNDSIEKILEAGVDSSNVCSDNESNEISKSVKITPVTAATQTSTNNFSNKMPTNKNPVKKDKIPKINKTMKLNDKILNRKFKKAEASQEEVNKVVDPFFVTATGANYLSVAEPRAPDEVKEIHKQGNRKLRRAVMFGHVPRRKPRKDNYRDDNFKQDNNNRNNKQEFNNFSGNENKNYSSQLKKSEDPKPEKLHPSWEAKKKQSGILPFQGKKIVFGDS